MNTSTAESPARYMQAVRTLLHHIISILILGTTCSCKSKSYSYILDAEPPTPTYIKSHPSYQTQAVDNLVIEISNQNRLEGKHIGIDGHLSKQRDYVQELIRLADTSLLIKLTSHKNPIVRVVSFDALAAKAFTKSKDVFEDHIEDNETFKLLAGCLSTAEPVNLRMYSTIKNRLTRSERIRFGKLLKEQLRKSHYWAFDNFDASI